VVPVAGITRYNKCSLNAKTAGDVITIKVAINGFGRIGRNLVSCSKNEWGYPCRLRDLIRFVGK
jgi:glyceraldehyde-3-phosphate dehydrogenase/erythrose-4-phosphate dehydrogenase